MEISRKTIVLVDDVGFHLISIKDRLKERYKVFTAQSVEILFEILEQVIPDLILMDLNMPEVDGFEAMKKLKANRLYSVIPVIVLSSSKDRKSAEKVKNLGAVDYISKPFTDADLTESIECQLDPLKMVENRPVVLVVDDDPGILKSVNFQLENRYKMYTLPDPCRIGELLRKITPDLFLLDCNMPGCSGFDLIPIIRSYPEHKETPIVFLTTEGTNDVISVAIHLGAKDYILKPPDGAVLREKLSSQLKGYIMQRRIRKL
jgi:PleD family two-component response regulator